MSLSPNFVRMIQQTSGEFPQLQSALDLVKAIREGLPATMVDRLVQSGKITNAEIDRVVLPRKTLAHRKQIGTLTADQSDRMMRVVRVIASAEDTFGTEEKAATWLRRPTSALNGETPLGLLDTEEGAREVETLLTRIAHGIAA